MWGADIVVKSRRAWVGVIRGAGDLSPDAWGCGCA